MSRGTSHCTLFEDSGSETIGPILLRGDLRPAGTLRINPTWKDGEENFAKQFRLTCQVASTAKDNVVGALVKVGLVAAPTTLTGIIGNITAGIRPNISGTAKGHTIVNLLIDSANHKEYGSGPIAVTANGKWKHRLSTALKVGNYTARLYSADKVQLDEVSFTVVH